MNKGWIEKNFRDYKILGVINFETVTSIYKQGVKLIEINEKVKLDFADVSHADSSALALLLSWLRFAKKKRRTFTFINLPAQLVEIANVCEVMPFLSQYISGGSQ